MLLILSAVYFSYLFCICSFTYQSFYHIFESINIEKSLSIHNLNMNLITHQLLFSLHAFVKNDIRL